MKKYDLIIIGGGGGTKLRPLADAGWKVAIIEKDALGGTCLNRGCIPSKMLIHPAEVMDEICEARKYGISEKNGENLKPKLDFEKLISETTKTISGYSQAIAKKYNEHQNIDFYHGVGRFLEDRVVEVNGEKLKEPVKITAEKILIATGSRPAIPDIPGLEGTDFWTNEEALTAKKQPKRMIVIGGGYIGVELGYFYGASGTEVEFLVRSKMVKNEDFEVQEEFERIFSEKFKVHFGVSPTYICQNEQGEFEVEICGNKNSVGVKNSSKPKILKADALLMATGVRPNSDNLDLENTGIKCNDRGFIEVDENLETSVPGVYAMGDVIGRYLFRHSVNFEGEYLLEKFKNEKNKVSKKSKAIDYPPMPHAIFTNPQIAGVGVTEDELKTKKWQKGRDYLVGKSNYKNSAMGGDAMKSEYGFCKLIFENLDREKNSEISQKTESSNIPESSLKLIGAHIIGPESSNMIHTLIAFMNMEATLADLLRMIYIHPALPEIVRNAARDAGKIIKS